MKLKRDIELADPAAESLGNVLGGEPLEGSGFEDETPEPDLTDSQE